MFKDLKDNCAIMNTETMKLTLRFKGEIHVVDLTEGDLYDNWNCIEMSDGVQYDFNLYWEVEGMRSPSLSLYSLLPTDDGNWTTNTDDAYEIKIHRKHRSKKEYFKNN